MRRRLVGAAATALMLVACNAILGLDGDTEITEVAPADGGNQADAITFIDATMINDGNVAADIFVPGQDANLDAGLDADAFDDPVGIRLAVGDLGGPGLADGLTDTARFTSLSGLARDGDGNRYVIDGKGLDAKGIGGTVIRKIDAKGVVSTLAGKANEPGDADGTDARFAGINGITSDGMHTLYITEGVGCRVRSVDTFDGAATTLISGCVMTGDKDAGLIGPTGLVVGPADVSSIDLTVLLVADPPTMKSLGTGTRTLETLCGSEGPMGPSPGTCKDHPINASDLAWEAKTAYLYYRQGKKLFRYQPPRGDLEQLSGTTDAGDGSLSSVDLVGSGLALESTTTFFIGNGRQLQRGGLDDSYATLAGDSSKPAAWIDGPPNRARFEGIGGLATTGELACEIADKTTLRMYSKDTGVTTIAGRGLAPAYVDADDGQQARIAPGASLTSTADGLVYFYEPQHATVRSYDPKTSAVKTVAGTLDNGATTGDDNLLPFQGDGIIFDGTSLIFSAASGPNVRRIDPTTHAITTLAKTFALGSALTTDLKGTVYVTSTNHQAVLSWKASNPLTRSDVAGSDAAPGDIDLPGKDAKFGKISGLCYDASLDVLVVADPENYKVRKIVLKGGANTVSTLAGDALDKRYVDSGPGIAARFLTLDKVACDGKGFAYLNDPIAGTIRRINITDGIVSTVVGIQGRQGILVGALPGSLNTPLGPLVLPNGHLLVGSAKEAAILDIHLGP